jgi:hypothetical protein
MSLPPLTCVACWEKFSVKERQPLSLFPCGHSLCAICYETIKEIGSNKCPHCREIIQNTVTNWELISLLPHPSIIPLSENSRKAPPINEDVIYIDVDSDAEEIGVKTVSLIDTKKEYYYPFWISKCGYGIQEGLHHLKLDTRQVDILIAYFGLEKNAWQVQHLVFLLDCRSYEEMVKAHTQFEKVLLSYIQS